MRRRLFSALTALTLTLGVALVAGSPATAATVTSTAMGGITYQADDANVAAGATVLTVNGDAPKALVIPASVVIAGKTYNVTSVAPDAAGVIGLTSVTLPNTVTSVGNGAFVGNSIASLTLSSTLLTIGEGAFAGNQLTSVSLPLSLRVIDSGAFVSNKIDTVVIPSMVTVLDDAAFADNPLTSAGFSGPPPTTFTPATPASGAPIGSLGDGKGLNVFYLVQFGAPGYANGYTSPIWMGYRAAGVGVLPVTPPTTPPGTTPPGTPPPTTTPGPVPSTGSPTGPMPKITKVKTKFKGKGLAIFRITVTNLGGSPVTGLRVFIKNRPHGVTYPGKKSWKIGTLAPFANRTVSIKVKRDAPIRTKYIIKALSNNAPRATARKYLPKPPR